jgi:peptidoglycan/xylan/chitin deacetylase (PgdA/CDA1 family)
VCASLRYELMLWSYRVTGSNARADIDETPRRGLPASIVLAQDGGPQPNPTFMQQLDRLVGTMTDAGYRFVTVSELLAPRGPGSADGVPCRPHPDSP